MQSHQFKGRPYGPCSPHASEVKDLKLWMSLLREGVMKC